MPFRARLSQWRQKVILTARWCFHLEIDDIKERGVQAQINGLVELNEKANETIKTLVRITAQMQARLKLYEQNIPRMRELKHRYDREQAVLEMQASGGVDRSDMANGILPMRRPISS